VLLARYVITRLGGLLGFVAGALAVFYGTEGVLPAAWWWAGWAALIVTGILGAFVGVKVARFLATYVER
jgi:hypothetical protein